MGREGGQHDQHFGKNKFVKNRVGGRAVNLNLDNVCKYTGFFFGRHPLATLQLCNFAALQLHSFVCNFAYKGSTNIPKTVVGMLVAKVMPIKVVGMLYVLFST